MSTKVVIISGNHATMKHQTTQKILRTFVINRLELDGTGNGNYEDMSITGDDLVMQLAENGVLNDYEPHLKDFLSGDLGSVRYIFLVQDVTLFKGKCLREDWYSHPDAWKLLFKAERNIESWYRTNQLFVPRLRSITTIVPVILAFRCSDNWIKPNVMDGERYASFLAEWTRMRIKAHN